MRLFIAADFPVPVKEELSTLCAVLRAAGVRGRYVRHDNMHLTLCFLGETPPARLPALCDALDKAVSGGGPFTLRVSGWGHFGRRGEGAVLWLGLRDCELLTGIQRQLTVVLRGEGFSFDAKPFRPHITLARDADLDGHTLPLPSPISFDVNALTLFESRRDATGCTQYIARHRLPLGTGEGRGERM